MTLRIPDGSYTGSQFGEETPAPASLPGLNVAILSPGNGERVTSSWSFWHWKKYFTVTLRVINNTDKAGVGYRIDVSGPSWLPVRPEGHVADAWGGIKVAPGSHKDISVDIWFNSDVPSVAFPATVAAKIFSESGQSAPFGAQTSVTIDLSV